MAERVRLAFDESNFAAHMRRAAEAARIFDAALDAWGERAQATWEPHDWRDFD